jgi:Mg-chelatase subunit ChlD
MLRQLKLLWIALIPLFLATTAVLALASTAPSRSDQSQVLQDQSELYQDPSELLDPDQQLTPAATKTLVPSSCTQELRKWIDPTSIMLGDNTGVTLVVSGTCPTKDIPIDLVLLVDISNSMTKAGLQPGVGTPTIPSHDTPDPSEPPPLPTDQPPPAVNTPGSQAGGGEPPFCNPIPPAIMPSATPTRRGGRPPRGTPTRTPVPSALPTQSIDVQEPGTDTDWIREEQKWLKDFLNQNVITDDMKKDRLRVGFVSFNQRAVRSLALTNDRGKLSSGINSMQGGNVTHINNGLREALRVVDGTGSRKPLKRVRAIIILSDFQFCAKDMRVNGLSKDVYVMSVGFGVRDYDRRKLFDLASNTHYVADRHQLKTVMDVYNLDMSHVDAPLVSKLTVTDELSDTMKLIPGSVNPPTVTITGQVLEWQVGPPVTIPMTFTYRVEPQVPGLQLPVSKRADAVWTDTFGLLGGGPFPAANVDVIFNTPTPTDTSTPTLTPIPTDTPTPIPTPTRKPLPQYLPIVVRNWPPPTPTPSPAPTKCVPEEQTIDTALVIDTSTSMSDPTQPGGQAKLAAAIEAAGELVALLKPADQATIIGFNSKAYVQSVLTGDKAALGAALQSLYSTQAVGTHIDAGLQAAYEELISPRHKSENHRSVVLVTDGKQVGPPGTDAVVAVADQIKNAGILLVTVGLGADIDEALLKQIASPGLYYPAPNAEDLVAIYREIALMIPCP